LATWLYRAGVRLTVVSACESAGRSGAVAETVFAAGVPAVVGMHSQLRDACQPLFSRTLYGALVDGATVEDAVAEARQSLAGTTVDWSVPILRCQRDLRLFSPSPARPKSSATIIRIPPADRPLIGREAEVQDLQEKLRSGAGRLLTLTGPGGVGKTRLAIQIAREAAGDFPDGVWFVECDTARDPEQLYATILATIGAAEKTSSLLDSLVQELGGRYPLLVLDCCEALAAAGHGTAVEKLMSALPDITLLATSRAPLGLGECETVVLLDSLKAPNADVSECASVDLFLQTSGLDLATLNPDEHETLLNIVSSLEGIPLAIVLAAGRLRHVSLTELHELLRIGLLKTLSSGSNARRHDNLSNAIAGSLELIPRADRLLLRRLCVFSGGFAWGDAVAVLSEDPFDLLDGLTRLTDSSLLRCDADRDKKRFRLLDTIREYASAAESPEPDIEGLRRRHAAHFASQAKRIHSLMTEGRWAEGIGILWSNLGNFRSAIVFADEVGMHREVVGFTDALSRTYMEAGLLNDFAVLAAAGHRAAEALDDQALDCRLFGLEGALAARRGDDDLCWQFWTRRAELCDRLGDADGAADALIDMAVQVLPTRNVEEGLRLLDEAHARLGEHGKPELRATVAVMRARVALERGDPSEAKLLATEAERLEILSADRDPLLFVDLNLGRVWDGCDQPDQAESAYIRVIRDATFSDRRSQAAAALMELSQVHERRGQIELGWLDLVAAKKLFEHVRSRRGTEAKQRLQLYGERNADHPALRRDDLAAMSWSVLINEILRRTAELRAEREKVPEG
jgi:predicted ATPase